jgi:hypothetical protein
VWLSEDNFGARATVDENGVGGQTPIFHAATQFNDRGLTVAQLLVERGADLSIRAKLPGYYERPDEVVECTPYRRLSRVLTVRLCKTPG